MRKWKNPNPNRVPIGIKEIINTYVGTVCETLKTKL